MTKRAQFRDGIAIFAALAALAVTGACMKAERVKWARVIKESGAKPE